MKKNLLLGAFFLGSFLTVKAQSSCDTALEISIGTTTVGDITGSYTDNCFAPDSADAANWYYFSATENGAVRINTDLAANDGETYSDDTRVSVYTGTCDELTCWMFSDDVDFETGNYLTNFEFQVLAGETYYIAFDNNWNDLGFQVEVSFTALSCFPVTGGFAFVGTPTSTEVTIEWNPAINSPQGYEILWGESAFDPETEGTLIQDLTAPQVTLSPLTGNTDYAFYVRTVCDEDNYSEWIGPINFTSPVAPASIPYAFGFEDETGDGWSLFNAASGSPWSVEGSDEFVNAYEGDFYATAGAYDAASDAWLFSRGLNLSGGTNYNVSYYLKKFALEGAGNVNNLTVTIGTEATVEGQSTVIATLNDYSEEQYVMQSHTFDVPETGVYYIAFNYTAPAHIETNYGVLALDNFSVDVSAGLNEELISKLKVSPNPTDGVLNINNSENILIDTIAVTDLNGRTVKSFTLDGVSNAEINISDLASGVYMMTISSDNGKVIKKVIKN
ncbi:T9SS-dependent choice-of-anchor J family protein [Flavobacterium sp. NRK1]|uniref:T9SS-dependent choice-of-anchor J family protein n=1 Tax=Flavobacterium sp. NRK1 TaxID=2954929 RepID=UPI002093BA2D|nr:T9SS type A sorting domain-containing protein [Flavobacterium sp. NRK1]MCO6149357.1 T9SS type A sorting domain-containing protein [Flavobacterium sp. NRK1]